VAQLYIPTCFLIEHSFGCSLYVRPGLLEPNGGVLDGRVADYADSSSKEYSMGVLRSCTCTARSTCLLFFFVRCSVDLDIPVDYGHCLAVDNSSTGF
jgi:hypothetical protein